jgi:uncharacterized protein YbjQ (UPF0145 family)
MIVSTTAIDSQPVTEFVGVVTGEAVLGAHLFRDPFAGLKDIVGGRSAGYERSPRQARETAIAEMVAESEQLGADAVVGVDVDYESIQIGQGGSMLMVSASGTAVRLWRSGLPRRAFVILQVSPHQCRGRTPTPLRGLG